MNAAPILERTPLAPTCDVAVSMSDLPLSLLRGFLDGFISFGDRCCLH